MDNKQPLWKKVFDEIKIKIQNEYNIGDTLPGDHELIELYNVSRITIRRALDELVNEGLIKRERGKGTIVINNDQKLKTVVKSSFSLLKEHNMKSRNLEVIGYSKVEDEKILTFFEIDKPTKLLKIERSHTKSNKKIAKYTTYINPKVSLYTNDNFEGSLYDLLESKGCKITKFVETVSTTISTEEEMKVFDEIVLIPILTRQRCGYNDELPVEYTIASYNGNEYTMVVENN